MKLKPGQNPNDPYGVEKRPVMDLKKAVERSRADIALSNPVGFLIRLMGGEEIDGERLSLRDRMDVAKYLTGKQVPNLEAHEISGEVRGMPPPLVISLNVTPQESMRVVSEQMEKDDISATVVEHTVSGA